MTLRNLNKRFTAVQMPVKLHMKVNEFLKSSEENNGTYESLAHFVATACINELENRIKQNIYSILIEGCEEFDGEKFNLDGSRKDIKLKKIKEKK